jgi:hypothetical protein
MHDHDIFDYLNLKLDLYIDNAILATAKVVSTGSTAAAITGADVVVAVLSSVFPTRIISPAVDQPKPHLVAKASCRIG